MRERINYTKCVKNLFPLEIYNKIRYNERKYKYSTVRKPLFAQNIVAAMLCA